MHCETNFKVSLFWIFEQSLCDFGELQRCIEWCYSKYCSWTAYHGTLITVEFQARIGTVRNVFSWQKWNRGAKQNQRVSDHLFRNSDLRSGNCIFLRLNCLIYFFIHFFMPFFILKIFVFSSQKLRSLKIEWILPTSDYNCSLAFDESNVFQLSYKHTLSRHADWRVTIFQWTSMMSGFGNPL